MSSDSNIFADTHSELSDSITYECSDPKCDWPAECQGNHGYSNNREESTVEWKNEAEDILKGDVVVDQPSPKVRKPDVVSGSVCRNWDLENSGDGSANAGSLKGDVNDERSADGGTSKGDDVDESSDGGSTETPSDGLVRVFPF